ncbi:MAG: LCP family protein [Clostridiaceae bacterium]
MRFKGSKILRNFLVAFLVICGVGVSAGTYVYSTLGVMNIQAEENPETTAQAVEVPITEPMNILLLGTDFGTFGAQNEGEKRTDTIMVAHYDPKLKKMFVVSIPRDTKVKINGKYTKINDANTLGGTKLAVETVEDLLDIDINYYVEVNYQGFNKIIDAMGGVTLTVPQTMIYDDASQDLHINFKKGETVELDGKRAEEFFRWRKNNDGIKSDGDGSDLGRIENQRVLLKAMIDKVSNFNSISKIPSLINTATSCVTTNMTPNDILKYGVPFAKLGNSNIEFETVKGTTPAYKPGEPSYFVYEPSMNKEILAALNGEVYLDKENLTVDIINATGDAGVATKYKNRLVNKYNYKSGNITTDLLETPVETTTLIVYGLDKKYEEVLKKDFGVDKIEFSSENKDKFDMILTVGKDYSQNNN